MSASIGAQAKRLLHGGSDVDRDRLDYWLSALAQLTSEEKVRAWLGMVCLVWMTDGVNAGAAANVLVATEFARSRIAELRAVTGADRGAGR